jgi:orotidine-5'-phosphate decarboxylase
MGERIIPADKSVVLAADVPANKFEGLVAQMDGVEGVGGVKVGFEVGLGMGLRPAVDAVLDANDKLMVIYDHQKAGNDIPDTGMNFARTMRKAGVDAAILFPFNGPVVEEAWIRELQQRNVGVIVGAEMTHKKQRASEEGYIMDAAFERMFAQAVGLGVRNFVVPGNKTEKVELYKGFFDKEVGEGEYTLWAPGFVTQGGDVSETGALAGPNFHAIVGSGIYANKQGLSAHDAAVELGAKMLALNEQQTV